MGKRRTFHPPNDAPTLRHAAVQNVTSALHASAKALLLLAESLERDPEVSLNMAVAALESTLETVRRLLLALNPEADGS